MFSDGKYIIHIQGENKLNTETYFIIQKDTRIKHKFGNLDNLLPYGELGGKSDTIYPFVAAVMILLFFFRNCNRVVLTMVHNQVFRIKTLKPDHTHLDFTPTGDHGGVKVKDIVSY
jgi:hypothetical protein